MAQVNYILREVTFSEEELKKIAEAKESIKNAYRRPEEEGQSEEPDEPIELIFDEVTVYIDESGAAAYYNNPYTEEDEEVTIF